MLAAMFAGILGLTWWLFSLIGFVLGIPLSWWLYYKSLFNAAQTDGATYPYMRSVLTILINIAWCVWMVLGINGMGEFSGGEHRGHAWAWMAVVAVVVRGERGPT